MKTKNILTMLLVAVALLLGANNVKADEVTIDESHSYWNQKEYTSDEYKAILAGMEDGATLRIYTYDEGDIYIADGKWTSIIASPNDTWLRNGQDGYKDAKKEGMFEIEINNVANIKSYGLIIRMNGDFYKVTYENPTANGPLSISKATNIENGDVTIKDNLTVAERGTEITLTATPAAGYKLKNFVVTKENGGNVTVSADGKFTMPGSAVTVSAEFISVNVIFMGSSNGLTIDASELASYLPGSKIRIWAPKKFFEINSLADGKLFYSENQSGILESDADAYYNATEGYFEFTLTAAHLASIAKTNSDGNAGLYLKVDYGNSPITRVEMVPSTGNYTITIAEVANGSVTASPTLAAANTEITLTPTPSAGCKLYSITVTDADGNEVTVTDNKFLMPASDVTVTPLFTEQGTLWMGTASEVSLPNTLFANVQEGTMLRVYAAKEVLQVCALANSATLYQSGNAGVITSDDYATYYNDEGGFFQFTLSEDILTLIKATNDEGTGGLFLKSDYGNSQLIKVQLVEPTAYAITASYDSTKGTVTGLPASSFAGNTVGFTVSAQGYRPVITSEQVNVTYNQQRQRYEFAMPANEVALSISFSPIYTVTPTTYTDCTVQVDKTSAIAGEEVEVVITNLADGYLVSGVKANDTSVTANNNGKYVFNMPEGNVTVTVELTAINYTVSIGDFENGSVSANGGFFHVGETVELTVSPATGSELTWIYAIRNDYNSQVILTTITEGERYSFTMPASGVTVNATFGALGYHVNTSVTGQGGTISANKTSYAYGETVILTPNPATGYHLVSISSTDVSITANANGQYTFDMPSNDVSVTATFELNVHTLTYMVDGVQYGDVEALTYGATITPRAEPTTTDADKSFSGWSYIPSTMPDQDLVVTGYFNTEATAVIGTHGFATFSNGQPLDFSDVTAIKAYIARRVSNNTVELVQVTGTCAAGTGLVVIGNTGSYKIPVASTGKDYSSENLLKAVLSGTTIQSSTDYVLTYQADPVNGGGQRVVFAATTVTPATIPAGHAYLQWQQGSNSRARALTITFSDSTTGIGQVETELTGDEIIYNLRGQRVEKPGKGLYIINGKKVFIK